MKAMGISDFDTHARHVFCRVARTKKPVVVTKRGKPLVEVVPFQQNDESLVPGKLSHTLVFEKDIVSPLGEST